MFSNKQARILVGMFVLVAAMVAFSAYMASKSSGFSFSLVLLMFAWTWLGVFFLAADTQLVEKVADKITELFSSTKALLVVFIGIPIAGAFAVAGLGLLGFPVGFFMFWMMVAVAAGAHSPALWEIKRAQTEE
jgi:hypothetical protein